MVLLQERGELELRVTKLLQECKSEGNIILMIDEVGWGQGGRRGISWGPATPVLAGDVLQC